MTAATIIILALLALLILPCLVLIVREEWRREGVFRWRASSLVGRVSDPEKAAA